MLSGSICSTDPTHLSAKFADRLGELLRVCRVRNLDVRVGTTVRGPIEQARMWCSSRCVEEVVQARETLKNSAPRLAGLLLCLVNSEGRELTTHLPGNSWHQWGEAADVFCVVGGKAVWEGSTHRIIAEEAKKVGLHGRGRSPWHLQLREENSPLLVRGLVDSWEGLEKEMLARFEL